MAVCVCYQSPTRFRRYTVADAGAIPKGTLLKMTTPMTAAASSADNDVPAGILIEEKVASDGIVEVTAALDGVWGITSTAAGITIGNEVTIGGADSIKIYTTLDGEKGYTLGRALETTAGSNVIAVAVFIP